METGRPSHERRVTRTVTVCINLFHMGKACKAGF